MSCPQPMQTSGNTDLREGTTVAKTGNAVLTTSSNIQAGLQIDIREGTISVSDVLANSQTLDLSSGGLASGVILELTASSEDSGSAVKLADDAAGTVRLKGGLLHISGDTISLGNSTLELANGSGLVAINYETPAHFANDIIIQNNATAILRAWGNHT